MRENVGLLYLGRRGAGVRLTVEIANALEGVNDIGINVLSVRKSNLQNLLNPFSVNLRCIGFEPIVSRLLGIRNLFIYINLAQEFFSGSRIILCVMSHPLNLILLPFLLWRRSKYILIVHEPTRKRSKVPFFVWVAFSLDSLLASHYVFLSENSYQEYRDRIKRGKSYRVFSHGPFDFGVRHRRRLPSDGPIKLLFFGYLTRYKGLNRLIEAFNLLCANGWDVTLGIYGEGHVRGLKDRLAGIPKIYFYNSWVSDDDIPRILQQHHLCLIPYDSGSQSGVVPMALQSGLPVVCTPVGGLPEQLEDGSNSIIADDMSSDAFYRAVAEALQEEVYEKLSLGAFRYGESQSVWVYLAEYLSSLARCR